MTSVLDCWDEKLPPPPLPSGNRTKLSGKKIKREVGKVKGGKREEGKKGKGKQGGKGSEIEETRSEKWKSS